MTLDVLARGGANDTNSATIRPSSDAEVVGVRALGSEGLGLGNYNLTY